MMPNATVLATAALLAAMALPSRAADAPKPAVLAAPAATRPSAAPIERQEIRAQLTPRRYTTLAAEIGAKVSRIPLAEGAAFRQGQLLVAFDCTLPRAQLDKAQAELDGASQTYRTNQQLAEHRSVGQLEVDLSRAAEAKARAEVGAQRALLSKCGVAAPFSGRIAEQKVREQQFVQAGQPLLDIIDDSVLELEFLIPSSWLAWAKVGSTLQVGIDETGKTYPVRLIRLGARVDPVSQSVKVAAAIEGRFPELMAGMSGRVSAGAVPAR